MTAATVTEKRMVEWLRDAHAMEKQVESILRSQAEQIEGYPDIQSKYEEQADLASEHAELVKECLHARDVDPSLLKSAGAKLLGGLQSFSGHFVGDEVVKSVLVAYTITHMKIASYRILLSTAKLIGDTQSTSACEQILYESKDLVSWLHDLIESTAIQYLVHEEREERSTTS